MSVAPLFPITSQLLQHEGKLVLTSLAFQFNTFPTNNWNFKNIQFIIFAALFAVAAAGTYKVGDYKQAKYETPAKPEYVSQI